MKLKVKSWGATKGVVFSKGDTELYDLEAGDEVEVKIKKDINWNIMSERLEKNE